MQTETTKTTALILTESQLVKFMQSQQGDLSQKEFAKKMKISSQYLSDVYSGRRAPGPSMLKFLKLEKVYRRK